MPARRDRIAILGAGVLAFALCWDALRPVASYDAWFHVATGREIWAIAGPLREDPFSFTHAGAPWPWQDGLADLLLAACAAAGPAGLVLFKAASFALTLAVAALALARAGAAPGLWVASLSALAGGLSFRMLERPESLGYLCLMWLLYELDRWRAEAERGRACGRRPWRVLAIVWLNAQCHRGAVILPIVLLAFAVSVHLERRRGGPDLGGRSWFFVPASVIALCLTPYGLGIFGTSRALLSDYANMHEFAAPEFGTLWALSPWSWVWVFASLAALWVWVRRGVGRHLWELAQLLMGLVLFSRGLRFAPFVALFGVLPLARALMSLQVHERWRHRLSPMGAGVAVAWLATVLRSPLPGPELGARADHHPVVGVEFIRSATRRGHLTGPMFNTSAYGGYVLSEFSGELPVYVDGRVDLVYPPRFMRLSAEAMVDAAAFSAEAERWGIDWVFIDNAPQRVAEGHFDLHPDFGLVHVSTRALIYVRKSGPDGSLWRSEGYRVVKPHYLAQSVEAGLADPRLRARTIEEVVRMYDSDPANPYAQVARARLVQGGLWPDEP